MGEAVAMVGSQGVLIHHCHDVKASSYPHLPRSGCTYTQGCLSSVAGTGSCTPLSRD